MVVKSSSQLEQRFVQNFETLSAGLHSKNIVVAVSGGVDSIALLLLMHKFAQSRGIKLTVLTVNHHLRPEAAIEVACVARLCEQLDVACITLDWDPQNNYSNLSARARLGRYDLMTEACIKLDILTLLTAHHIDDSLETFLIKRKRKSGKLALSTGNTYFHNNIRILRPLFNITKLELIDYVQRQHIEWMEDSSNLSDKYLRNNIRKEITSQSPDYKSKLQLEQQQIDNEAGALNLSLIEAIAEAVKIYKYGFAVIDIQKVSLFDYEVQLRLLSYVLNIVSGKITTCRGSIVAPVVSLMKDYENFTKTLHGCVVKKIGGQLLIYRNFGKVLPQDILVKRTVLWDKRFHFTFKEPDSQAYITNLKLDDYREIKEKIDIFELKKLSLNHHNVILFTLPIIKVLEKVVALPHISYYDNIDLQDGISFSYRPSYISRFIHFY